MTADDRRTCDERRLLDAVRDATRDAHRVGAARSAAHASSAEHNAAQEAASRAVAAAEDAGVAPSLIDGALEAVERELLVATVLGRRTVGDDS